MNISRMTVPRVVLAMVAVVAVIFAVLWVGCNKESQSPVTPSLRTQEQITSLSKSSQLQSVLEVHKRHTDRLLTVRGVVGTAVGATDDGRVVVKVYTKDGAPGSDLPTTVEGIPVVAEVTGPFFAFRPQEEKITPGAKGPGSGASIKPTGRWPRPVPIGVSTGNEGECSAGTIGARVIGGSNVYALSNNHVYALENKAPIGSRVLQPGLYDTGCLLNLGDVIGTLAKFEPITFSTSASNKVDAAIALSSTGNLGRGTPSGGYGMPNSITLRATLGLAVQKYGRTTGLTKGKVTGINATVTVDYGSSGVARFVDQIIINGTRGQFSKAGDSGSLIVTDNSSSQPVGLLFAGSASGTTIANRIDLVLAALNVSIDGK